jgi:hypothetical protein
MFKRDAKMTKKEVSSLKAEILKVTPAVGAVKTAKTKTVKLSKKAQAVQDAVSKLQGGWHATPHLKEAFEAILGEKLPSAVSTVAVSGTRIDKSNLKKFQAVVPEGDARDHSGYNVGEVILLTKDNGNVGLKADGTTGGAFTRSSSRYATRPEIDKYLATLEKTANVYDVASILG